MNSLFLGACQAIQQLSTLKTVGIKFDINRGPVIVMLKKRSHDRRRFILALGLGGGATSLLCASVISRSVHAQPRPQSPVRQAPARNPQQVPTARYGRGEAVDLSLIVEEWRDRYPDLPVYVCNCNADTCGNTSVWPFRDFARYQSSVALGASNAASNESTGFNCFDMETGERPIGERP